MNAVNLLKADHKQVKGLFEQFRAASDGAHKKKQGIAEQVFTDLQIHTTLEEELFYPAVQAVSKDLAEDVGESLEEHHVVKLLVSELQELAPEAEQYDAKFTVLMENVEHHVEEEEGEMFPEAEEKLGPKLEALGDRMAKRKDELKTTTMSAP